MTKGGARWQEVPSCDVARVCGYSKDDGFVASYFQISREQVQAIRKRMQKPAPAKRESLDPYAKTGGALASGEQGERQKAEFGSERLKEACHKLFWKFELKHRLPHGYGQKFQLEGYRA